MRPKIKTFDGLHKFNRFTDEIIKSESVDDYLLLRNKTNFSGAIDVTLNYDIKEFVLFILETNYKTKKFLKYLKIFYTETLHQDLSTREIDEVIFQINTHHEIKLKIASLNNPLDHQLP